MAIEHMDNFRMYGVGGQAYLTDGVWAQAPGLLTVDPDVTAPSGSVAFQAASSGHFLRYILGAATTTVGMGCRLWLNIIPTSGTEGPGFVWINGANVAVMSVTVSPTGSLNLRRGDINGTIIQSTPGPVITANGWYHIEAKYFYSDTVGTMEVRVEGVPVLVATNLVPAVLGTPPAQVRYNGVGGFALYYKDLIIWNGTGANNNNFLGAVTIVSLTPSSDVAKGGWLGSSGTTLFNLINGAPPTDDVNYIYDPTPTGSAVSSFNMSDLDPDVTSVRALMPMSRAKKTDGGDGNLQQQLLSGASTANGADRPITAAYTYWRDVIELDPATSALWTPTGVNAVKLQLDRNT